MLVLLLFLLTHSVFLLCISVHIPSFRCPLNSIFTLLDIPVPFSLPVVPISVSLIKFSLTYNFIASKVIENGRHRNVDKQVGRDVNAEIATLRGSITTGDKSLTESFTETEMKAAISHLKNGKAQCPDHIAPEFISNCGTLMLNWLREFFSQCMCSLRLPKVWRRADIIAVLKPNKPADGAKNYRPISLKLLERLLLSRLDPVIDPQLPPEQAGFRHGRSTTDQVTLLTDDIEAGFEQKQKVGVALVDLSAAYDTVWLRGLHLKLLRMLPVRHMVSFVMELLTNRSFTLKTSDGQVSRLRRIHNGVPQGYTLARTNPLQHLHR